MGMEKKTDKVLASIYSCLAKHPRGWEGPSPRLDVNTRLR